MKPKPIDKKIFASYVQFVENEGVYPSVKGLADIMGKSPSSVRLRVNGLSDQGVFAGTSAKLPALNPGPQFFNYAQSIGMKGGWLQKKAFAMALVSLRSDGDNQKMSTTSFVLGKIRKESCEVLFPDGKKKNIPRAMLEDAGPLRVGDQYSMTRLLLKEAYIVKKEESV